VEAHDDQRASWLAGVGLIRLWKSVLRFALLAPGSGCLLILRPFISAAL
jgi:hypothetical protein